MCVYVIYISCFPLIFYYNSKTCSFNLFSLLLIYCSYKYVFHFYCNNCTKVHDYLLGNKIQVAHKNQAILCSRCNMKYLFWLFYTHHPDYTRTGIEFYENRMSTFKTPVAEAASTPYRTFIEKAYFYYFYQSIITVTLYIRTHCFTVGISLRCKRPVNLFKCVCVCASCHNSVRNWIQIYFQINVSFYFFYWNAFGYAIIFVCPTGANKRTRIKPSDTWAGHIQRITWEAWIFQIQTTHNCWLTVVAKASLTRNCKLQRPNYDTG